VFGHICVCKRFFRQHFYRYNLFVRQIKSRSFHELLSKLKSVDHLDIHRRRQPPTLKQHHTDNWKSLTQKIASLIPLILIMRSLQESACTASSSFSILDDHWLVSTTRESALEYLKTVYNNYHHNDRYKICNVSSLP
jgi:hypothetical protein